MNISKQAIEAGARAEWDSGAPANSKWESLSDGLRDSRKQHFVAGLTAALEHIIPKESDHAMFSVFDTAYGERDTHAWQNRVFRGLTAILSHLRGEGKRAEASTPPTVKECLTVEPNPDDVERVARAMFSEKCSGGWKDENISEGTRQHWRDIATAAIRAMKGRLWGVVSIPMDKRADPQREEWYDLTGADRFYTTDKSFCESIVANAAGLGMNTDWFRFEVRPYTAPREESAEMLANDFVRTIENRVHLEESSISFLWEQAVKLIREAEKRGTAKCG